MSKANIKLDSALLNKLKKSTGELTGQKAVEVALSEFMKFKSRINLKESLSKIEFTSGFNPLILRKSDR